MNSPEDIAHSLALSYDSPAQDFNYQDHNWLEQLKAHALAGIIGPLSRADERAMRDIKYFNLPATVTVGSTVLFDPGYNIKPDFWVFFVSVGGAGSGISLQEESQDLLTFILDPGIGSTQQNRTIRIPGKSRNIAIGAIGVPLTPGQMVAAAVWGYDPKDIF
jgi:hypothetical protein